MNKGKNSKISHAHKKSGHRPPSRIGSKWTKEQREKFSRSVFQKGKGILSLRHYTLLRDNYTCQGCGLKDEEIVQVDHIKNSALFPELKENIDNLQTLCPNCHARKTNIEIREILKIKRWKKI